MSKRQERIKCLVGMHIALENGGEQSEVDKHLGEISYNIETIEMIMETVLHLLREDGVTGIRANDKVTQQDS